MNGKKEFKEDRGNRRQLLFGMAALAVVAAVAVALMLPSDATGPRVKAEASLTGNVMEGTVAQGAQLVQTFYYTPCGHEMTRKIPVPQELLGKTRQDVETAYDQWRVTSFAPLRIDMEQKLDIHCAQHLVLKPDESGMLAIFQNKYGDALAIVKKLETAMESLPEAEQEDLRTGKSFENQQELEQWLESVES